MGACASCLGLVRRENQESDSARLLDDDLYPSQYGYGSFNNSTQQAQSDPEDLKREREALEAICQRASDSVIDIWALQPQPHLQPQATLRPPSSSGGSSSKIPNGDSHHSDFSDPSHAQETSSTATAGTNSQNSSQKKRAAAVPKQWGEVVMTPRKSKNNKVADANNGNDFFGVLRVT